MANYTRRQFVRAGVLGAGACGLHMFISPARHADTIFAAETPLQILIDNAPVARYWISANTENVSCSSCHEDDNVQLSEHHLHEEAVILCQLCAQECIIFPGERGLCRARINVGGELRSLVYGHPVSIHVDPIEKKPFYHFLPGSEAFSISTAGCPLHCQFCQNWQLSQMNPEDYSGRFISPEEIISSANRNNSPVIAYTYNEPTVFTEYLLDISRAGKRDGIRSVLISCGFMNSTPLADMCEVLDAIKIDLKGFSEEFYRNVCHAELTPVLRSIRQVTDSGVHLEIVNLVVPTLNDSELHLRNLCNWVFNEIGPDVPIHFTRFHPDYRLMNLPPTPISTLENAREIALDTGIHYPFVGNVPGHPGNHTYCPGCGRIVLERSGFFLRANHIHDGKCEFCETEIAGVWE